MDEQKPDTEIKTTNGANADVKVAASETPVVDNNTPSVLPPSQPTVTAAAKKKFPVKILAIVAAVVVLAGAGYGVFSMTSKNDTKSVAKTEVVKKDIANLRYATASKGWNVFYPDNDNSINYIDANLQIFEGLVRYENKTQIVPLLATGWTNPDDSTWVFTLKDGVKFHTGRVMTAEDVKLSFEAAKKTPNGELYGSTIKSVEVSAPNKVTIKTDGPDPILLNKLASYFIYDTKSGKNADPINGTGAYQLKPEFTIKDEALELAAFDDYHGGRPHVRTVSYIYVQDQLSQFYEAGKGDLVSFNTAGAIEDNVIKRPYNKLDVDQSSVLIMPMNSTKAGSPLQKLKVRQAMQLAIDSGAIAAVRKTMFEPASQILTKSTPGYDSSIPAVTRDVTKAKQLLIEAGYPNGFTIDFTYFAPSKPTADEFARQLKEIGVTLRPDPQDQVKNLAAKAFGGKADTFFITVSSDLIDGSDVFDSYGENANYSNEDVRKLMDQAKKTLDATKRLKILKEISRKLAADVNVVTIYSPVSESMISDQSIAISRDVPGNSLGVYFRKAYAK